MDLSMKSELDKLKSKGSLFSKIKPLNRQFDKILKYLNVDPKYKNYRIICFADLHSPYILGHLLDRALAIEFNKPHLPPIRYFVIDGDLNQFDEFGKFVKFEENTIIYAIRQSRRVLRTLGTLAPVYWLYGNHDLRPHKRLYELLDPDLAKAAEQFGVGLNFPDVIRYGLKNVKAIPFSLLRIDDVAFCHFNFASIIPGRSATWSYDVIKNYVYKGYITKDVNVVVQGHNHGCTPGVIHSNKLCIESGCLCPDLDYALMRATAFSRTKLFENGYVSITVKDGKADWSESRAIPLVRKEGNDE